MTMKSKTILASLFLAVGVLTLSGKSIKSIADIPSTNLQGNLSPYPYVENEPPAQTPAPAGYEPFHIEHYGRHGSRWLIGANDYLIPVKRLESAERAGKLTSLGVRTLAELRRIQKESVGREGELTGRGAVQHQAIGRRMARNYPQIFTPGASVNAKSTVVIRCILSMLNGLRGVESVADSLNVSADASHADMRFMNFDDKWGWKVKDLAEAGEFAEYKKRHDIGSVYLSRLVTDEKFARDSVAPDMLPYLYWVLGNAGSHAGQQWLLEEVFSREELEELWRQGNAKWFIHGGLSELTSGRMPYTQRRLLTDIIESTDTAMMSTRPSANLRYGHDGILLNLITLIEAGDWGERIDDLDSLETKGWRDYEMIPMGGNLQLVFYRPAGSTDPGDVLVKALVNEREVTLPATPVTGPYYRWTDLRGLYLDKLRRFHDETEVYEVP